MTATASWSVQRTAATKVPASFTYATQAVQDTILLQIILHLLEGMIRKTFIVGICHACSASTSCRFQEQQCSTSLDVRQRHPGVYLRVWKNAMNAFASVDAFSTCFTMITAVWARCLLPAAKGQLFLLIVFNTTSKYKLEN